MKGDEGWIVYNLRFPEPWSSEREYEFLWQVVEQITYAEERVRGPLACRTSLRAGVSGQRTSKSKGLWQQPLMTMAVKFRVLESHRHRIQIYVKDRNFVDAQFNL